MSELIYKFEEAIKYYEENTKIDLKQKDTTVEELLRLNHFTDDFINIIQIYRLELIEINFLRVGLKLPGKSLLETYITYNNSLELELHKKGFFIIGDYSGAYILGKANTNYIFYYDYDGNNNYMPIKIATSLATFIIILINIFKMSIEKLDTSARSIIKSLEIKEDINLIFWVNFQNTMNN